MDGIHGRITQDGVREDFEKNFARKGTHLNGENFVELTCPALPLSPISKRIGVAGEQRAKRQGERE